MKLGILEEKIKEILLSEKYITKEDLKQAEKNHKLNRVSVIEYLLNTGIISKAILGQAIAEQYKVAFADLNYYQPTREQVLRIPKEIAKKLHLLLFKETEDQVILATDYPSQILDEKTKTIFKDKKIILAYAFGEEIETAFIHYKAPLKTRFSEIIASEKRIAPEIIQAIIEDALIFRASDIHFEPQSKEAVIRFRIDGVLREAGRLPKLIYENILNRIKVSSNMQIDEHYAAQDGTMRLIHKSEIIDMRISVVPTLDGETVAIRLLSQYVRSFTLEDIGLSPTDQELVKKIAKKPFGMILATGPTGSGKTTSLYALLKILNATEVNITTIEEPVEYRIVGTSQIQINPRTNLTFAKGLRSIIRQDPDIILVGEIRDRETAEIAVNAALTGHLLLSSFHANDASTAIPRLLDMGIEPFLLASTLELVVAQRLVRQICPSCRHSKNVKLASLKKILPNAEKYFQENQALYEGKGCASCNQTGFKGRTAIFELIPNSGELNSLILKNPSSNQIQALARTQGHKSMFEDGIQKVKFGLTTLEELLRVASPEG